MSDADQLVKQMYEEVGDSQTMQIAEAIAFGGARESVYLVLESVDSQLELSGFYELSADELPHYLSSAVSALWVLRKMAERVQA